METVVDEIDHDLVNENIEAGGRGKARETLIRELEKEGNTLAEAFKELTPLQKGWGRLVGRLRSEGKGSAQIENCFSWFEVEYNENEKLDNRMRMMAMFQAVEMIDVTDDVYRACRKILITLVQSGQ